MLPIANMPTEQCLLPCNSEPKDWYCGPLYRAGDYDVAPGSVTTKDKQKHLSIGITGPIQLARGKLRRKANQDMPWTWRDEVTIDLETNALVHVGNVEHIPEDVPWVETSKTFTAVKPAGFRSQLHKWDHDAWATERKSASHSNITTAAREGTTLLGCRYDLILMRVVLYILNDNSGDGFVFQHLIERRDHKHRPCTRDLEHQWLEKSVTREMDEFDSKKNATSAHCIIQIMNQNIVCMVNRCSCCWCTKNYRCVLDHSVRNQKFPRP